MSWKQNVYDFADGRLVGAEKKMSENARTKQDKTVLKTKNWSTDSIHSFDFFFTLEFPLEDLSRKVPTNKKEIGKIIENKKQ